MPMIKFVSFYLGLKKLLCMTCELDFLVTSLTFFEELVFSRLKLLFIAKNFLFEDKNGISGLSFFWNSSVGPKD